MDPLPLVNSHSFGIDRLSPPRGEFLNGIPGLKRKALGQDHYSPSVIAKASSYDSELPAGQQPRLPASDCREMAFQCAVQGIGRYAIPHKKSRKNISPPRSSGDIPI